MTCPKLRLQHSATAMASLVYGWKWWLHALMDALCFLGVLMFRGELACRIEHMAKAASGVETTFSVKDIDYMDLKDPIAFAHRMSQQERHAPKTVKRISLRDHCPACNCLASASCRTQSTEGGKIHIRTCHLEDEEGAAIKDIPVIATITDWALLAYCLLTVLLVVMSAWAVLPAYPGTICLVMGACLILLGRISPELTYYVNLILGFGYICFGCVDSILESLGRPRLFCPLLCSPPSRSEYIKCAFALNFLHGGVIYLMTEGTNLEASFGVTLFNDIVLSLDTFLLKGPEAVAECLGADLSRLMPWIPSCFYSMYEPTDWDILQLQAEDGAESATSPSDSKLDSKTEVRQGQIRTAE